MKAERINCVALDFETTGVAGGWPSEPWQIGSVCIKNGLLESGSCYESLIRVGERPVNPNAPGMFHSLRNKIRCAPEWNQLLPEINQLLKNRILVAHNVSTERNLLTDKAPLHRFGPWIDTLKLTRSAYPGLSSYKLEDLSKLLGLTAQADEICPGRNAHDALYDAICCGLLLTHLIHLPQWSDLPLERITC